MPVTLPGRPRGVGLRRLGLRRLGLRRLGLQRLGLQRLRVLRSATALAAAVAIVPPALTILGAGTAVAEPCAPHCDYAHYYGPYDFTYARPALFGAPRCDAGGDCAPHLAYTTGLPWPRHPIGPGGITVRLPRVSPRP